MTLAMEIEAFGRRLGLQGLRLGDEGAVSLRIDGKKTLTLQKGAESEAHVLLMTLAVPVASAEGPEVFEHALERASVDAAPAIPFSVGMNRDQLVFGVRLRAATASAAALENAFRFLLSQASAA